MSKLDCPDDFHKEQGPAGQRWVLGHFKHIQHIKYIQNIKQCQSWIAPMIFPPNVADVDITLKIVKSIPDAMGPCKTV